MVASPGLQRHTPVCLLFAALVLLLGACGDGGEGAEAPAPSGDLPGAPDTSPAPDGPADAGPPGGPPFVVVTFNTGTSLSLPHDRLPEDGYGPAQAAISDTWYGNGLAWAEAVEAARAFFVGLQPDLVFFQEIFFSGACADIPIEAREGFVCEGWSPGDPTVARRVLGPGYQVVCHPGRPDKCAAVRLAFGRFRGCDRDLCLEGLRGYPVKGCGSGVRVARGIVDRVEGPPLTVVSMHGTSGVRIEEQSCRVKQVEQVFVDLGDGAPGVDGDRNLVAGDFNTDPGRFAAFDLSAERWRDFAGEGLAFRFISSMGPEAPGSYAGHFDIDHVVADRFDGSCWIAGLSEGHPAVFAGVYFDHKPVVCGVSPAVDGSRGR